MSSPAAPRRLPLPVLVGVAVVVVSACLLYYDQGPVDDAWITYRYARNLAEGAGFAFNPGHGQEQGSSTPLFTLLLASAHALGLDIPRTALVLSALSLCGIAVIILAAFHRRGALVGGVFAVALLLAQRDFVHVVVGGMETAFYVVLVLGAFELWARERRGLAFGVAALCVLTRLDGLAVPAALVAYALVAERRVPWRGVALPAAALALWLGAAWLLFGDPLPASWLAKRSHTGARLITWHFAHQWIASSPSHAALAALGAPLALTRPRDPFVLTTLLFACAYLVAFSLAGVEVYAWYLAPLQAAGAVLAGHGFARVWASLARGRPRPALGFVALLAVAVAAHATLALTGLAERPRCRVEDARRHAARAAAASLPHDATVFAGAVGMIGWFHRGRVRDVMGLTDPELRRLGAEVAPAPRDGLAYYRAVLPSVVARLEPELVFTDTAIDGRPEALEGYTSVVRVPYRCVDHGAPRRGAFTLLRRVRAEVTP